MSIVRLRISKLLLGIKNKSRNFSASVLENEYTKFPEYPPIIDVSPVAARVRVKEAWHSKIQSLKTVEEKLFAVNLPKYYGWHCFMLNEGVIPYNALPLTQFITRTHIIKGQPECYSELPVVEAIERLLPPIRVQIEEALKYEYSYLRERYANEDLSPSQLDDIVGSSVVKQINRILILSLSPEIPHIEEVQVDLDPRLESFWFVGQIDPPAIIRRSKEGLRRLKDVANNPVDRCVQYIGSPHMQLRSDKPLPPFVKLQTYDASELPVPTFTYDPRVLGVTMQFRNGTNIPGFWPGDASEFGVLSYHGRGHLLERPAHYGVEDFNNCLIAQAVLASYGWTLAQASYQGFSTFNELTYPLTTQSVVTNGQIWSFFSYQLNTTVLHSENATENPRRNICWASDEEKLFEAVDGDQVVGLNESVLRRLMAMYLLAPAERVGVDLKPYLDQQSPHVADVADSNRRDWLHRTYRHMYSNRPRGRLPYEVYDWERIYKIDNKTRPLDKKTRPFELHTNPYKRKYSEHQPEYVPKKHRLEDKKNKNKWSKTYYP